MYITIKFIHPNLHSSYIIGSLCVAASFAFIFMPAIGQDPMYYTMYPGNSYWTLLYYAPFIVIFQFGWASTQISHLSLIPSLSSCEHDKVGLNSIRSVSISCRQNTYAKLDSIYTNTLASFCIGEADVLG